MTELPPNVYRYRQGDFDAIPGSPWVYWITPGLRRLFQTLPKLGELAAPRQGLATADNFRFLRVWWEVGTNRIACGCLNARQAERSGKTWFPYMKGGSFRRWYGNQEYVVNWSKDGAQIKNLDIESGRVASRPQNTDFYFRRGVTWTDLTSGRFSARLSPGGFIFDVKGSSAFPDDIPLVLGLLNSSFAQYALSLINPTVSFQVGDVARLPIPTASSDALRELVDEAIALARQDSVEDETTYDFVAPPDWSTGLADLAARRRRLSEVERLIDEEVYRLYDIGAEDRAAIEAELRELTAVAAVGEDDAAADVVEEDDTTEADEAEDAEAGEVPTDDASGLDRAALAERWVSYAVGVVLGRFQPGMDGALGRGCFSDETAAALRALADADGVAVVDPGHPDDLTAKVERALDLIVGADEAQALVQAATGGRPLADFLVRDFFKRHVQRYRKRPVYWLFQSPKRGYSLYVFHERATRDTLYLLLGNRYLGAKRNEVRDRLAELRKALANAAPGAPRRRLERQIADAEALLTDLDAFHANLTAVVGQMNERGEAVGWQPEIDDGVLINLAPLHTLVPAWSTEPRQCWEALERGEYDWSHTAMRYWPDRVRAKCRTNKSYAIAHGIAVE